MNEHSNKGHKEIIIRNRIIFGCIIILIIALFVILLRGILHNRAKAYVFSDEGYSVPHDVVFYDYEYDYNIRSSGIDNETITAVLAFVNDYYKVADEEEKTSLIEEYPEFFSDDELTGKFVSAYTDDFDMDGNTETFALVDIPVKNYLSTVLVFIDSTGNFSQIDVYTDFTQVDMLDYGDFRQIAFGCGYGRCEADNRKTIYGVVDGKPTRLLSAVGFGKSYCFVATASQTRAMALFYYDNVENEYVNIARKEFDKGLALSMTDDKEIKANVERAEHVYTVGAYYFICEYEYINKSDNYDKYAIIDGEIKKTEDHVPNCCEDNYVAQNPNLNIRMAIESMKKKGIYS